MGCSIHGWIEIKKGNSWYGVVDANSILSRNLNLFANLCGDGGRWFKKSNDIKPMTDVRGLPADVSDQVVYNSYSGMGYDSFEEENSFAIQTYGDVDYRDFIKDYEKYSDYHTASWIKLSEILNWDYWKFEINEVDGYKKDENGETLRDDEGFPILTYKKISFDEYVEPDGFWIIVDLMRYFVNKYDDDSVRFVYWFDN